MTRNEKDINEKLELMESVSEMLMEQGPDAIADMFKLLLNHSMRLERDQFLGASPWERTESRKGYANGFKDRTLKLPVGEVQVSIPQVRGLKFYPRALEQGSMSERALKLAIAEMYVQGVSTRRVTDIVEQLCGLSVSSTQVSRLASELDGELDLFRNRMLHGEYPVVYLDAIYEKIRSNGAVVDMAVLVAVGVTASGMRGVLGVSAELSEAEIHWRNFLEGMQRRGLKGVKLIVSDDHSGLGAGRAKVMPSVPWQRCVFHLAQNAQSYCPATYRRQELGADVREVFREDSQEAAVRRCREVCEKWKSTAPAFSRWFEEAAEEGMTFYMFKDRATRRRTRTVNVVERLNEEIRRRTRVARLFPNEASCNRLVTAVLMQAHENWASEKIYINPTKMELEKNYRKNVA